LGTKGDDRHAYIEPAPSGDSIPTEIIEPRGLSVTAAAGVLQVSRPALSSLLNVKSDLSGDMALRIEIAFGVKMDTVMRMQASYDTARTRKREHNDPSPALRAVCVATAVSQTAFSFR
jgi:addiction module HigA family antidote